MGGRSAGAGCAEHLSFVAQTGELIANSSESESLLDALTHVVVPELADTCVFELAMGAHDRVAPTLEPQQIVVPLAVGRTSLGRMVWSRATSARRFGQTDLTLAVDLGHKVALALENARLRELAGRKSDDDDCEERLRLAAHAAQIGTFAYDCVADRAVWSDSMFALLGLDARELGASRDEWRARVHPDDRARVDQASKMGPPNSDEEFAEEYRVVWPDGRVRWLDGRGRCIRDDSGRALRVFGAVVDITDRVHAESEIRFQAGLLEAVEQAVVATDLDGRVRFWNSFAEGLFGWTAAEAIGNRLDELLAPEGPPDFHNSLASGARWSGEVSAKRRVGELLAIHVTNSPVSDPDGKLIGIIIVSSDMAERRQAQELRERTRAALAMHAREQAAVADLGLWALTDAPLPSLVTATVNLLAGILDVELAALLELAADSESCSISAAVGWPDESMSESVLVPLEAPTLLGRVFETGESISVADAQTETRFQMDSVLHHAGARSGLAVSVPGRDRPRAVLLGFSRSLKRFSEDDMSFLQALANVLAAAIERKTAEDALRRREHEFKVLVEHAADVIVRVNREFRFLYVNPATERAFGVPGGRLVGETLRSLSAPEHIVTPWELALARVFRTGEDEELELAYPTPRGERHLQFRMSPDLSPDGTVDSVLGVGRDVTEQRRLEVQRTEVYAELLESEKRLQALVERLLLTQVEADRTGRPAGPGLEQFNRRERQILQLLARGLTNPQIGQELHLSPGTVKNYVASLLPRLNASDRTQAAVRAVELGLVGPDSHSSGSAAAAVESKAAIR